MKVIPLSEATANLSHYGRTCHDEPVIVTVNGVPSFQLVPLSEDDDLIDSLLQHNVKFRQTLKNRLKEQSVPIKEVRERIWSPSLQLGTANAVPAGPVFWR